MEEKKDIQIISADEKNVRIDKFLSEKYKDLSRTYFQYLIEEGFVTINGKKTKKRVFLKPYDKIEVFFKKLPEIELTPQDIPLDIIYEDEDIIAINKPHNMVVHPAPGNKDSTFANALLYHCKKLDLYFEGSLRPGIVHRLDKDTTGILLAAKTSKAHMNLSKQFSDRSIEKKYLAIALNKPTDQAIEKPIKRSKFNRKEMTIDEEGKKAISIIKNIGYENIENKFFISLLEIELKTGRTHQIRVHLKSINSPILGDTVYGSRKVNNYFNEDRQFLHAYKIKFFHPIKNNLIELSAPIPKNFKYFLKKNFSPKNLKIDMLSCNIL